MKLIYKNSTTNQKYFKKRASLSDYFDAFSKEMFKVSRNINYENK